MSKLEIGRGAGYLFAESIIVMLSSYGFWLVISRFASAELIGTYSSVLSLSSIFVALITIGVPSGIQRFLGKSFMDGKLEDSSIEVISSVLLVFIGTLLCTCAILAVENWMRAILRIDYNLLLLLIVLNVSNSIYILLRAIIISSLRTKGLTRITIISTAAKFFVAALLVLTGAISLALALSTAIFPVLMSILLAFNVIELLKHSKLKEQSYRKRAVCLQKAIKSIFVASMAGWIPNLVNITGSQLGIILVNGSQGASQAGLYFISYSIVSAVLTISTVLQTIAYPALSGMHDGRKRFAWRMLRLTLVIILPFAFSIMFYSKDIVQIFGQQYLQSHSMLEIMMISILPTSVAGFTSILVYSYGYYKQVLAIGLSINIPRVALYFILVPFYGGDGAATSFFLGSIGGLVASIIIAKKIKMQFLWRELTLLFVIPSALAFIVSYVGLNYMLGVIVTIIASYLLFLKFKILDRTDLADIAVLVPAKLRDPRLFSLLVYLIRKLNPSF